MSGDKTEEPTEHKLREARKKGQVSKSQDIIGASIFMVGFLLVYFTGNQISQGMQRLMILSFNTATKKNVDLGTITSLIGQGLNSMFEVIAPLCGAAFIVAILANYLQIGTLLTMEPLKPDIKKLNPIEGLKGMFKLKKLIELLKSSLKLMIVGFVAYSVVKNKVVSILFSIKQPLLSTIDLVWELMFELSIKVGSAFAIIAAFDYAYQKWQYKKDMMMSKKDIKDEYKTQEGDPFIKGQRKQLHQEMAMSSATEGTRKAQAVVANPEHIAVAIRYDDSEMGAPQIVAKGENHWAKRIKEIAKEEGIPILRNVPLAAALNELEIGEEVPEDLYDAIAEILQFVYSLSEAK